MTYKQLTGLFTFREDFFTSVTVSTLLRPGRQTTTTHRVDHVAEPFLVGLIFLRV